MKPVILHYQLTERCDLACPGCYLPERQGGGRSADEVAERVFRPLSESGVRFVTLTGGEPLLHSEHMEIFKRAALYFTQVLVVTNGRMLTLDKYRELCRAGVTSVKVSLDSLVSDVHDRLRGVNGTYDLVMTNLNAILDSKEYKSSFTDLGLIMTVHKENVSEMADLAEWARGREVDHVLFQPYHPYDVVYMSSEDSETRAGDMAGILKADDVFTGELDEQIRRLTEIKRGSVGFVDNSIEMLNSFPSYYDGTLEQMCRADRFVFVNSDFGVRGCLFCEVLGSLADQSPDEFFNGGQWAAFQQFREQCRLCLMGCQFKGLAETLADDGFEFYLTDRLPEAEECFGRSLDVEDSISARHGMGIVLRDRGDYVAAIECLRDVVDGAPKHIHAWLDLADVYRLAGDVDGLLVVCRKLYAENASLVTRSRLAGLYCECGSIFMKREQFEDADAAYVVACDLDSENFLYAQDHGLSLKKLGRFDEAREAFKCSVKLADQESFPHYALGVELARIGKNDDAESELKRSLALDGGFGWCHFQLGQLYRRRGDESEARRAFEEAVRLDPENEEFRRHLSGL